MTDQYRNLRSGNKPIPPDKPPALKTFNVEPKMATHLDKLKDSVIPKFEGTESDTDAESWLLRFERVAKLAGLLVFNKTTNVIEHDHRCEYFPLYLKHGSSAETWYNNLEEDTKSDFSKLKASFLSRFPTIPGTRIAGLMRYNNIRYQEDDSIDSFIDKMQRKGKALEKCENDIRDMVILALPQKMREFVISHEPQTLSDVKKYMELSKALQAPKVNVLEETNFEELCTRVYQNVIDKASAAGVSMLDKPPTVVNRQSRQRHEMGPRSRAPGPSPWNSKPKTGMTPNYNNQINYDRVCLICGAREHQGPCPHLGKRCYSCGGGHLARVCRAANYRPNTYVPRLNYQSRQNQGNQRH